MDRLGSYACAMVNHEFRELLTIDKDNLGVVIGYVIYRAAGKICFHLYLQNLWHHLAKRPALCGEAGRFAHGSSGWLMFMMRREGDRAQAGK